MKKLFVLTREDLPLPDQAVQAGHVVAAYMIKHEDDHSYWRNEILVYLVVKDEAELLLARRKLEVHFSDYAQWREPDRNNELTALATTSALFAGLKLMGT